MHKGIYGQSKTDFRQPDLDFRVFSHAYPVRTALQQQTSANGMPINSRHDRLGKRKQFVKERFKQFEEFFDSVGFLSDLLQIHAGDKAVAVSSQQYSSDLWIGCGPFGLFQQCSYVLLVE